MYNQINLQNWSIIGLIVCVILQIRRQQRLRREYLIRKSYEEQKKLITDKKQRVKNALDGIIRVVHCFSVCLT